MTTHQRRTAPATGRMVVAIVAATLLTATAAAAPATAGSTGPDEQGYWWRSPALAVDQTVPEGGLVVAGSPEGPLAVSALRFELDDPDTRAASIHLKVDTDTREAFVEEPLLWACPPDNDWEPAEGGDWADAPGEHCSPGSAAEGELGEEEGEYVFVVSQFIQNGQVDVMITPGVRGAVPSPLLLQELNKQLIEQIGTGAPWPGPPTSPPGSSQGAGGSNFRVTFEAPDGETLRTGQDSADDSITSLSFDGGSGGFDSDFGDDGQGGFDSGGSPSTARPPDTSGSGGATGGSSPTSGSGMGSAPQPETAQPPQADGAGGETTQATPPQADQAEAPVALEDPQAGGMGDAEPASSLGGDPRLLGALILALGAVAAGMLAMNQQRSELGGLAQFARPRKGTPINL